MQVQPFSARKQTAVTTGVANAIGVAPSDVSLSLQNVFSSQVIGCRPAQPSYSPVISERRSKWYLCTQAEGWGYDMSELLNSINEATCHVRPQYLRAEHSRAEAAAAANANARWRPVSPARAARSTAGGPSMRSQALDVCIEDTWQLHSWMSSISGSLTLTGHQ